MISSAFVISIRNLPLEAETGFHIIFFALLAAIGFFIPVALVSAELATGWPKQGGVYVWIKQAFGDRLGFAGIWLQWTYMLISVISMLYFVGGTVAFVFSPTLASSRLFLMSVLLIVIWGATLLSLKGQKVSGILSSVGFLGGVLLPGVTIIVLGFIYLLGGNPPQINMSMTPTNLFPSLRNITTLVLLVGFMGTFSGIEASASHAGEVENPKRNYPLAILFVVLLAMAINILGSLSVAIVVPQKSISLLSGLMQAYSVFFSKFHLSALIPIVAVFITMGACGAICTWLMGPVKGLHATAKNGELPPFMQKQNKNGSSSTLLIIQACAVSVIGGTMLLMPSLNIAFWLSSALAMLIYFTMCSLMLMSGIYLRYKEPNAPRSYKVPGRKVGIWIVGLLGLCTIFFSMFVAFLPPAELPVGTHTTYVTIVVCGILTILAIPFIIYQRKSPKWKRRKA